MKLAMPDGGFQLSKWFNRMEARERDEEEDEEERGSSMLPPRAVSVAEVDRSTCHECRAPQPEYMSTNTIASAPPVPVCSVACEAAYLKRKGWKTRADDDDARTESDERATKRQRVSLSYLDDFMLEGEEGEGYKSWWVGALAFFDFVYQRHGMWHSYSMGNNEPHVDPSLIKYWTCNMYRELDRSTAFLRKCVLRWQQRHQGRLSLREVLWMAVVFRYCNTLETFDQTRGIPSSDQFGALQKRINALTKRKEDKKIFAGDRQGLTTEVYLDVLGAFLEDIDDIAAQVKTATSTLEAFEALRAFRDNALGSFTCWQIVCDLAELDMFNEDYQQEEFVWLSHDAKMSLVHIFGKRRARPSAYVELAQVLQQRQVQAFTALKVRFPYFMGKPLTLKNIGHALHQFQIYRNIKLVDHGDLHKQAPGTTSPLTYASRSYLLDTESCEMCSLAENEDQLLLCDTCNRLFHKYCINMKELPPASWVCPECKKLLHLAEEESTAPPEVILVD